jgi:cytochrome bd-type quinol oxidase subunit 2
MLLVGTVILLPLVLGYTAYCYYSCRHASSSTLDAPESSRILVCLSGDF